MSACQRQTGPSEFNPGADADGKSFSWRGLGQREDLDIDFAVSNRAAIVTDVLVRCRRDEDGLDPAGRQAGILQLTLAARIGGLVAIYAQTSNRDLLPLALRCPSQSCGEPLEVFLPLEELLDLAYEAEEKPQLILTGLPGGPVRLRRPTGNDQRRWLEREYPSARVAEMAILKSLVCGPKGPNLDATLSARAAEEMESFDPLPCFSVTTACPACGLESDIPVDLESTLLAELQRAQRRMIGDIHNLALRYGWTETEILAIRPQRRAAYREIIAAEGKA